MNESVIRFDLLHPPVDDLDIWRAAAIEAHDRGYAALLCPDVPGAVDPFRALATAAAASDGVRVGTHVLAVSVHEPAEMVQRIGALTRAAPGRVDVGLGTGRPQTRTRSGAELRRRLRQVVSALRDKEKSPPVTIAAQGPRALALAGELADDVSMALPPEATKDAVAEAMATARAVPRRRSGSPGLALSLVGIGETVAVFHAQRHTAAELRAGAAFALLPDSPAQAIDTLLAWHQEYAVTRVLLDPSLRDAAQPVLDAWRAFVP